MIEWENFFYDPIVTATEGYATQLFGGEVWIFWAIFMMVTVAVTYVKSESIIMPVAVLIIMGPLLGGLLAGPPAYIFGSATSAGVGLILYLLYRGYGS